VRAQFARTLASLHAPEWRERYGSEFEALLIDLPASPLNLADVAASIVLSRRRAFLVAAGMTAAMAITLLVFAKFAAPAGLALSRHLGQPAACVRVANRPHKMRTPCELG
jgi:hypothetical protein